MRGLEEGPASSTSATTPDGPADVPKEPRKLSVHEEEGPGLHRVMGKAA